MSLFRHTRPLLDVRTPSDDDHDGEIWLLMVTDPDMEPKLQLRIWVQPEPDPKEPPPPPDCKDPDAVEVPEPAKLEGDDWAEVIVETSVDREVWLPVHAPFALQDRPAMSPPVVLGPYVRARTVSHGISHTARVKLLGNTSFRLESA